MKISVIGSGSFGSTLAQVLSNNNHDVLLWCYSKESKNHIEKYRTNPYVKKAKMNDNIKVTTNLSDIKNSELIIFAVPSFGFRDIATKIIQLNLENKVYVIGTKGIESDSLKTCYDILYNDLKVSDPIVILTGPTHAEELALNKITTIVSTAKDKNARELVQEIFSNEYLRVYTQSDVVGVELLCSAKNVLAIAAGVCDSHPKLGDNAKAALLTRGLSELVILGESVGASKETFYGLTGMGDLIVTAISKYSRNRQFGEYLGKGFSKDQALKRMNMVVEGLYSVKGIIQLANKKKINLPIINTVYEVLYLDGNIDELIKKMFKRELKDEK